MCSPKSFTVRANTEISICKRCIGEILTPLWRGFTYKTSEATFSPIDECKIFIGEPMFTPLDDGDEYTVCVTERGVGILARDEKTLIRGFMTFLSDIVQTSPDACAAPCREVHGRFAVARRMVHICVFPETTLDSLRRMIRLCGVLQYTHIITEFWGMLKFDSLKELSWPFAYEKAQVAELVREMREMGMEPIPMFNHFGHASQCRVKNGKHVTLDQNLALSYLFTPDGWAWDIRSEASEKLLESVRKELYGLFGDGEFVHLGCDEAYIYNGDFVSKEEIADYLGKITAQAVAEGRTPIIWADMITSATEVGCVGEKYSCSTGITPEQADILRSKLAPETVLADWQYDIYEGEIKSARFLKGKGYKTLICPFFKETNIKTCVDTATKNSLYGVMETTWHMLSAQMQSFYTAAKNFGLPTPSWAEYTHEKLVAATLIRKIAGNGRGYTECGFTAHQLGELND